ncbi:uncharacterized protein LOC113147593 [Cyclospora cayetanensis]|uniref:Uncharacterized protein LOC113147593 n=1 Tax=Cyclospora cayetanensis TaxID=88456 RepID=A0A6P6S2T4_9EIME|nr:uncharacterized protein LOC113147593 [Cyclospora cayetanensis]
MAQLQAQRQLEKQQNAKLELVSHLQVLRDAVLFLQHGIEGNCNSSSSSNSSSGSSSNKSSSSSSRNFRMCDPCMVPLTSQALLRAELLPSGAPILHLGSDYLAMLKPGAVADAPAAESAADSPDDTKGPPSAKAAESEDPPLTPAAGCLGVLQRRQRLLQQQLQRVEKDVAATRLLLGEAGDPLWKEAEASSRRLSAAAAAAATAATDQDAGPGAGTIQLTPEGFLEIREALPEGATEGDLPVAAGSSSGSSSSTSDRWVGGIKDTITERKVGGVQEPEQRFAPQDEVSHKRPPSKFKLMRQQQRQQQQNGEDSC